MSAPIFIPEGLTREEWQMVLDARQRARENISFNEGVLTAARLAEEWADQCAGGSGKGGEGYMNLGAAIRRLVR